ncbi:BRI3-binding protein [Platysternon megacephalum]|uniref:BRI3-binding protein n=1 Tax=Platysternon megacephalum TaxID=55544 RepID=A0A4D9ESL3_9SAUR|nr:BRI3-binding protein [Platysternon megacephalum]
MHMERLSHWLPGSLKTIRVEISSKSFVTPSKYSPQIILHLEGILVFSSTLLLCSQMGRYLGEFKEKAEKNKHLLSSLGIQALKNHSINYSCCFLHLSNQKLKAIKV